jgi:hypothetical protein
MTSIQNLFGDSFPNSSINSFVEEKYDSRRTHKVEMTSQASQHDNRQWRQSLEIHNGLQINDNDEQGWVTPMKKNNNGGKSHGHVKSNADENGYDRGKGHYAGKGNYAGKGKGHDSGKGKGHDSGKGKGKGHDSGKGKGKGKGHDSGKGKGHDFGKGKGKGKGKGIMKGKCLKPHMILFEINKIMEKEYYINERGEKYNMTDDDRVNCMYKYISENEESIEDMPTKVYNTLICTWNIEIIIKFNNKFTTRLNRKTFSPLNWIAWVKQGVAPLNSKNAIKMYDFIISTFKENLMKQNVYGETLLESLYVSLNENDDLTEQHYIDLYDRIVLKITDEEINLNVMYMMNMFTEKNIDKMYGAFHFLISRPKSCNILCFHILREVVMCQKICVKTHEEGANDGFTYVKNIYILCEQMSKMDPNEKKEFKPFFQQQSYDAAESMNTINETLFNIILNTQNGHDFTSNKIGGLDHSEKIKTSEYNNSEGIAVVASFIVNRSPSQRKNHMLLAERFMALGQIDAVCCMVETLGEIDEHIENKFALLIESSEFKKKDLKSYYRILDMFGFLYKIDKFDINHFKKLKGLTLNVEQKTTCIDQEKIAIHNDDPLYMQIEYSDAVQKFIKKTSQQLHDNSTVVFNLTNIVQFELALLIEIAHIEQELSFNHVIELIDILKASGFVQYQCCECFDDEFLEIIKGYFDDNYYGKKLQCMKNFFKEYNIDI